MASSEKKMKVVYRETLDSVCKARYMDKLKTIDDRDPYEMTKMDWSEDVSKWPELSVTDIIMYLVHTMQELKAYKSLESYNYFVSGWVLGILHAVVNGKSVLLGRVKHSQRMNDACLQPWLIIETDGNVLSGHCTCMAGIGEVCSHVGALLFAVEATVRIRNSKTVTDEKCYWLLPSATPKVQPKTLRATDFTSSKTKKRQLDEAIATQQATPPPKQRKLPTVNPPTGEELSKLFSRAYTPENKPVILAIAPGYAAKYRPAALDKKYPMVLSELYDESYTTTAKETLLEHCDKVFRTMSVTEEEAVNCEMDTRTQSSSKQWFRLRTGRVTASRMKSVCRTCVEKPSKSLVKDMCYPSTRTFSSKQTVWGCDHEKDAKMQYGKSMTQTHKNFEYRDSGLVISTEYPFMGASPDGLCSCDCCGEYLIEIKCPFCHRHSNIDDTIDFLEKAGDKVSLKKSHAYFYQIQCQLLVTGKKVCDFVVWTETDFFTERILYDQTFCSEMVKKSERFFKEVILPELIGKFYSRAAEDNVLCSQPANLQTTGGNPGTDANSPKRTEELICVCQTIYSESEDVIGCDNENCPFVWFHFTCVGIKRVPKGKWFCKACKKPTQRKRKVQKLAAA